MPIKSWAFLHEGHVVRAEILWHLTGKNRKRIYSDHKREVSLRGRFTAMRPMLVTLPDQSFAPQSVAVRFKPKWFRTDMECQISYGGGEFEPVKSAFVDKQWQVLGWDADPDTGSGPNFAFPIILSILIIMMLLYPMLGILGALADEWNDRQFRYGLKKVKRTIGWDEIQDRMRSMQSPGTLIYQTANLARTRVWWTPDDVAAKSPLPLPAPLELMSPGRRHYPFMTWCDHKYIN